MSKESRNNSNQSLAAFIISISALIAISSLSFLLTLHGPFILGKEAIIVMTCLPTLLFIVGIIINKQMK